MKHFWIVALGVMVMAMMAGATYASDDRFVFADETVKDKRTGLVWLLDANKGKRDWHGALQLVNDLNTKKLGGYFGLAHTHQR